MHSRSIDDTPVGEWEKELRFRLDDLFETDEYYDGPNIDHTFTAVHEFCKKFIRSLLSSQRSAWKAEMREKLLSLGSIDESGFYISGDAFNDIFDKS